MNDKKVLGDFHAKISKAKILYDTTSAVNQKLRREANQLQRQYENLKHQRIKTEDWEKDASERMKNMEIRHKQESDTCYRWTKELAELKNTKKQLQRQKIISESHIQKQILQLQQLRQQRTKLEQTVKQLSSKVNTTKDEKEVVSEQFHKTKRMIQKYNANILSLQAEIEQMRRVITENTVPVHKIYDKDPQESTVNVDKN